MAYAPTNWQDGVTPVNAVNMNKLEQGLAAAVGIPADVVVTPATAHLIRNRFNAADTQPAFRLLASGKMEFGLGGSAAPDVNLYRFGTTTLGIDGSLVVNPPAGDAGGGRILLDVAGGWAYPVLEGAGTGIAFSAGGTNQQGDWEVYTASDVEGFTVFRKTGGGATGPTGDLYRFTQGGIKFSAGGGLTGAAATAGFDVTLRRAGAGALQVDGSFYVYGSLFWTTAIMDIERAATSRSMEFYATGDAHDRLCIWGDGKLEWGDGTNVTDTFLRRSSPGALTLDNGTLNLNSFRTTPAVGAGQVGWHSNPASGDNIVLYHQIQGEANPRFYIDGAGSFRWGTGAAVTDTLMQRTGVNSLYLSGDITVAGVLNFSSAYQSTGRWFLNAQGVMEWGLGDWTRDTNLYRVQAGILGTDSQFYMRGASAYFAFYRVTDANARFYIGPDGQHNWGPGNVTQDTNLYRSGVATLRTDGSLSLGGALQNYGQAVGSGIYAAAATGDAQLRFQILNTGALSWGAGAVAQDTTLYRASADILKTDDHFQAGFDIYANIGLATQVRIGNSSSQASIAFGSTLDTVLSRTAAGVLALNGVPIATGSAVGYGTSLPGSPVDGQEYILVDSVTNPTYQWRFRWNAGQAALGYKWEFVGGAAAVVQVDQIVDSDTGGAYVNSFGGSPGPDFTVPRAGIYDVTIQFQTGAPNYKTVFMSYDIGATGAQDADAVWGTGGNYQTGGFDQSNRPGGTRRKQISAAGTLLHCVYKCGPGTGRIQNRVISVLPVRVI